MSDHIRFRCPFCDKLLKAPGTAAGFYTRCTGCRRAFQIPPNEAPDPASPGPAEPAGEVWSPTAEPPPVQREPLPPEPTPSPSSRLDWPAPDGPPGPRQVIVLELPPIVHKAAWWVWFTLVVFWTIVGVSIALSVLLFLYTVGMRPSRVWG